MNDLFLLFCITSSCISDSRNESDQIRALNDQVKQLKRQLKVQSDGQVALQTKLNDQIKQLQGQLKAETDRRVALETELDETKERFQTAVSDQKDENRMRLATERELKVEYFIS